MPGLKKLCANFLISAIDSKNVVSLIKVSRIYNLPRIEVSCIEFVAKNLEEVRVVGFLLLLPPKLIC